MSERPKSFLETKYPDGAVIMGGMGVNVSSPLAVAEIVKTGNIGTLSQTAAGVLLARELQDGDPTGMYRQVLAGEHGFPNQDMWELIFSKFYLEGGVRPKKQPLRYRPVERYRNAQNNEAEMLTVMGSYALVRIAQELAGGHGWDDPGDIGTNGLMKIPKPVPAATYGAMLARSRFAAHGAGVPDQMANLMDELAEGRMVNYKIKVPGYAGDYGINFDPRPYNPDNQEVSRPELWPIVSSYALAEHLVKHGRADALIVEGPKAGGHNAPASNAPQDPIEKYLELGVPIIVAGGEASRGLPKARDITHEVRGDDGRVVEVRRVAAVQAGTVFAVAQESAMDEGHKVEAIRQALKEELETNADPDHSPTGFPFWVAKIKGTLSERGLFDDRKRVCDLEILATEYVRPDGSIGYRCPSEPVENYEKKVRSPVMLRNIGRRGCLCNSLFAAVSKGQEHGGSGRKELAVVTLGGNATIDIRGVIKASGLPITVEKVTRYIAEGRGAEYYPDLER